METVTKTPTKSLGLGRLFQARVLENVANDRYWTAFDLYGLGSPGEVQARLYLEQCAAEVTRLENGGCQ